MDVIGLESAGNEHSRAMKKLREVAWNRAVTIISTVPLGVALPHGYKVVRVRLEDGYQTWG